MEYLFDMYSSQYHPHRAIDFELSIGPLMETLPAQVGRASQLYLPPLLQQLITMAFVPQNFIYIYVGNN